jgi:hypothetical protein
LTVDPRSLLSRHVDDFAFNFGDYLGSIGLLVGMSASVRMGAVMAVRLVVRPWAAAIHLNGVLVAVGLAAVMSKFPVFVVAAVDLTVPLRGSTLFHVLAWALVLEIALVTAGELVSVSVGVGFGQGGNGQSQ